MTTVRTRFAPSPTGFLHIGGARTALFNYLFARHNGGQFVLRIEDTDHERSSPKSIETILESLKWLQLDWDEGPYFQTQRTGLYKEKIRELLEKGKAYPCVCTHEQLDAKRQALLKAKKKPAYDGTCRPRDGDKTYLPKETPYTMRFLAPKSGNTIVDDAVKGKIIFDNAELDDLIIARSDGTPTYNFCVVVDDIDMAITHIIRGDDHLANTPRQTLLYQAFGYSPPQFAHLPLILGQDKSRLSKRHGDTSVLAYRDMGYFPEAVINFLSRLGWSHGDQEIFSRDELIYFFALEEVGKSAGIFNAEKLLWLNSHYLRAYTPHRLAQHIEPFMIKKEDVREIESQMLEKIITILQPRAKTLTELVDLADFYVRDDIPIDDKAAKKFLKPDVKPLFDQLIARLESSPVMNEDTIEQIFSEIIREKGLSLGKLAQPVRVALTGTTVSPGIYDVIFLLGKDRTIARLKSAVGRIDHLDSML